eukprot:jgi/Pico_ML_1/51064/g2165.t1
MTVGTVDMAKDETKEQAKALVKRRDEVEEEMQEILGRLNAPGGAGTDQPLVDPDGFPRSDLDVIAARNDRHKLARLKSDYDALTDRIQAKLYDLHASEKQGKPEVQSSGTFRGTPEAASAPAPPTSGPFAIVEDVQSDSPAAEAGLKVGDRILEFGDVRKGGNGDETARLATVLRAAENQPLRILLLRTGQVQVAHVVPRQWAGPGPQAVASSLPAPCA